MTHLFTEIKSLLQVRDYLPQPLVGDAYKVLPEIKAAWLLIKDDKIIDYGKMSKLPSIEVDQIHNCKGQYILPTWVDSHTHIVYAGNREQEFVDRINGLSYAEIAENGGGILNSAKTLQQTSFEDLYLQSEQRLKEVINQGTGAVEIKSGYGLTKEAELKMLRVIKALKDNYDLPIKASFLGAHALPKDFKKSEDYITYVIDTILPEVARLKLADYIDVFCEEGYFNLTDTERIIKAGEDYGLKAKIHVNQFKSIGGIALAAKYKSLSVDHLEVLTPADLQHLKQSPCIAVALPSCSFYLGINYTPVKDLIMQNIPLALASDFNPGSTPSGNMNFVVSLGCIKLGLTPEQSINSATINAAFALELQHEVGSITKGKKANFIVTKKISSYGFLAYAFGTNSIKQVWINGKLQDHEL